MKFAKAFFIILFIAILINNERSYSQSEWVLKSTGCNLNDVHFFDDQIGWVVGDSGTIIGTTDAGANWICVTSGTTKSLKGVYFINDLTGWVAGDGGDILKSSDGGATWITLPSGNTSNFTDIFFPTIDTGFAISPLSRKTTDGGTTWTSAGPVSGSAVFFSSALIGLATNASTSLARTTNGGTAWFSDAINYPSSKYAISFVNAMTGWVSGSGSFGKTTNGGANWTSQPTGVSPAITFFGLDFVDDMNGYSVGSSGTILYTSNGGSNWVSKTSGTTNTLRRVDFIDVSTGYVVGDKGILLYTTDGGSTWKNQLIYYPAPFDQAYSLNDVHFKTEMTGWTAGLLGYVNKTTDGGESWSTITTASFNWIFSMYFPPENDTGWVCGRIGTIQKTENGGINWVVQSTGTSQHLNSIVVDKFIGDAAKTGWCVGDNGTILATSSGGITWASQIAGTTEHLNSVVVFDDYNAIIAGNAGTILKTTDTGLNWVAKPSGTTNDLKSIHFLDVSNGYACGASGDIRITTDGGETWSAQTSGTINQLNSIAFEEIMSSNGYAVGENGTIVATTNGGLTWFPQSSGGTTPLYSVFVKDVPTSSSMITTVFRIVGKLAKYALKEAIGALPVELISFVSTTNENNVTLQWQTSAEINNAGFNIERSTLKNGVRGNWNKIGFVSGSGNSNNVSDYQYIDANLENGTYKYRLKQIDFNGNYEYYNLSHEIVIGVPAVFELTNYPNPFNPVTTIAFKLPVNGFVSLKIYDISGKEVRKIIDEAKEAGYYKIQFNGSELSSGIYFYKLVFGGKEETKKMVLVK